MTMIRFKLLAACAALVTGLGLGLPAVLAEFTKVSIKSPQDLKSTDGGDPPVKIASKRLENGLIEFVIRIDPDAVEKNDLYKGRITASGYLELSSDGKEVASIQLHAEKEKNETVFRFAVAETLAKSSQVMITTQLHEKDGKSTLGGGHAFTISLQGFLP